MLLCYSACFAGFARKLAQERLMLVVTCLRVLESSVLFSDLGEVIDLPVIQDPTSEDLVKWHAIYVEELKAMFDQYKGQFGFGDRELRCH